MYSTPLASRLSQKFAEISSRTDFSPRSQTTASIVTHPTSGQRISRFTSISPQDSICTTTVRDVLTKVDNPSSSGNEISEDVGGFHHVSRITRDGYSEEPKIVSPRRLQSPPPSTTIWTNQASSNHSILTAPSYSQPIPMSQPIQHQYPQPLQSTANGNVDSKSIGMSNNRNQWAFAAVPQSTSTESNSVQRTRIRDVDEDDEGVIDVVSVSIPHSAEMNQARRGVSFGTASTTSVINGGDQPYGERFTPATSYAPVTYLTREKLQELQRQRPPPISVNPYNNSAPQSIVMTPTARTDRSSSVGRNAVEFQDVSAAFLRAFGSVVHVAEQEYEKTSNNVTFGMDLLACTQGCVMIRYSSSGTPHQRFVFLELYPCEVTRVTIPQITWTIHSGAAHPQGRLPLTKLMAVSPNDSAVSFRRHMAAPNVIMGPYEGNKRNSYHSCFCFTAYFSDDREISLLAPNASVYRTWVNVLETFVLLKGGPEGVSK
eukprot:PhF_6_TR33610/c0_g1_i1/m.49078